MRPSKLAVFVSVSVLALCCAAAFARPPYVALEQRLSAEQLREVGLSAQQLATLNRMLSEAEQRAAPAQPQAAQAQAQADANRIISESITPELIQMTEAEARLKHGWVTVTGADSVVVSK